MPPLAASGIDHDVVDVVREFIAREVVPAATELDRAHEHPWIFGPKLADLGVFGAGIAAEYGGLSLNEATRVRIAEEIGYGWGALATTTTQQWVTAGLIQAFGTTEQKDRWLPQIADGSAIGSISLSEPGGGSDTSALICRADRAPDGFVLNGTKSWVTNGTRAHVMIVAARMDDRITAFIVEPKAPGSQKTMMVSPPFDKLGHRSSDTVEITYADHVLPADAVLGGERMVGNGQHAFLNRINLGRLHVGAIGLGIARAALDHALVYAGTREAFGKPIDQHQAIGFKLADMAVQVKAAQLMLDHAAAVYDSGADSGLEASMAKLLCSEAALDVSRESLRVHGGIGYVAELPVERFFRDAPLMAIGEGTNEIQHILIARALKARGGLAR